MLCEAHLAPTAEYEDTKGLNEPIAREEIHSVAADFNVSGYRIELHAVSEATASQFDHIIGDPSPEGSAGAAKALPRGSGPFHHP
jgi:hypothetical protein